MPKYAGLFRNMPVNASGMDFTHKCWHFPNPDPKGYNVRVLVVFFSRIFVIKFVCFVVAMSDLVHDEEAINDRLNANSTRQSCLKYE